MSKSTDGQDLTLVGPGTVMGEMMRQYWIPAALSSELSVDGDPMRLMLLGEQLIAFRDSSGRVGVLDHQCPHRCASLFLGRNEQDGIRCVYHGWKFDVDGRCLEMPNVPLRRISRKRSAQKATGFASARASYGSTWARGPRRRRCRCTKRCSFRSRI